MEYGANPNAPFLTILLRFAVMYNNIEVVKALLRYGAKVKQRDLTHAITYAKIEMLETLLIYVPDIDQFHTLYYAAYYDRIDVVKMLVKYGADVNRNVGEYRPPLITATRTANVRTMSELLKNGANANLKDYKGDAPIHQAAELPRAMKVLLNEGGYLDSNMRNKSGETAIEIALTRRWKDTAKMIFHYNHNKFSK